MLCRRLSPLGATAGLYVTHASASQAARCRSTISSEPPAREAWYAIVQNSVSPVPICEVADPTSRGAGTRSETPVKQASSKRRRY